MDPLSVLLSQVKPLRHGAGGLTAGGRWAIQFPEHVGVKCYAVVRGECWFDVEGEPGPVRTAPGDCVMLPHGRPFRIGSDLDVAPMDARTLAARERYNGILAGTPGDEFFLLGGHFLLDEAGDRVLGMLPPFVHLHHEVERASLSESITRIADEMRDPQPGGSLLAQQSAFTMLVLALRLHLGKGNGSEVSALRGLTDRPISIALASMHEKPEHAWTVEALAERAGMSRTTFAARFRETLGEAPMAYLTRWRMQLAGDRLRQSNDSVAVIGASVGYDSESAFSAAFKRTMGYSPSRHARSRSRS